MKQHDTEYSEIQLYEQREADVASCSRFGTITAINESLDSVRIDFEGNPFGQPISARLGRQFKKAELQAAIDNQFHCRVEFINGDVSLPVVTDILFSILDDADELVIKAKKIIIEGEQELIVKSGETQTRYSGRDARVTTKGKYVTSQAEKAQKIQGGTVAIN